MTVSRAIADPRRLRRFVAFVAPGADLRLLDISPGPGAATAAFAARLREVAILGEPSARLARLSNVSFRRGEPHDLPFPDGSFDIVTCGYSFHHLSRPQEVADEMARVCRPGGAVALEDIVASEEPVRAKYQNRLEKLRDRAHPGYLRLSEYVSLLGQAGLQVERVQVNDLLREFNEWLIGARPSLQRVEHIRRLMVGAVEADLSGLDIRPVDDTIEFRQRLAWIVARKPD